MSLKEKIEQDLIADEETVLEDSVGQVKGLLKLHNDGSINLKPDVRQAPVPARILAYLIGQEFAYEAERAGEPILPSKFFYERLELSERRVRAHLKDLREDGYVRSPKRGEHQIVTENIPEAIERIRAEAEIG